MDRHLYFFADACLMAAVRCPQGVLLIDAGMPSGFEKTWAAMQSLGLDTPQYVLITHDHLDHTQSCKLWRDLGAKIIADEREAPAIEDGSASMVPCPVDIRIKPDTELDLLGLKITAYHAPGHTAGSVAYDLTVDGERWLFTGDIVMLNRCPGYLGRFNFADTLATLQQLARLPVDSIATGHSVVQGDGTGLLVDSLLAAFDGTWQRCFAENIDQLPGGRMPELPFQSL